MLHTAYRYDIQAMRAVAVLAVVIFHINALWLPGGFLGVDLFFVMSGFIISRKILHDLDTDTFSLKDFYARRIKRLFPALFITISITALLSLWWLPVDDLSDVIHTAFAAIGSVSNIYFWFTSGYFAPEALERPLLHTWSLGVEEQFYLIFPVLILGLYRFNIAARRASIFILLISGTLASEWALRHAPNAAFYLLPFRGFEFLIGAFVASLNPLSGRSHIVWSIIGGLSFTALIGLFFLFNSQTPLPGFRALLFCTLTALLLHIAPKMSVVDRLFKFPPLQFIGNISYSIYLVHWPIIVLLKLRFPNDEARFWVASMGIILTLLLGAILHYCVEKPYRYTSLKRVFKGPIALSMTVLLSMFFAIRLVNSGGLNTPSVEGNLSDSPVLLIGDSNADMYNDAIIDRLDQGPNQLTLISSPGCPPLLGVRKIYNSDNGEKNQSLCDEMLQNLEETLVDHPAKIIIIAARWEFYGALPVEKRKPPRQDYLYLAGTAPVEDIIVTRQLFASSIKKTVKALNEAGKTVIVIGQIPTFENKTIRCSRQNLELSPSQMADACKTTRQDIIDQQYKFIRAKLSASVQSADAKSLYIDPVNLLCGSSHCELVRNERALYKNRTHLNNTGAEIIINEVARQMTAGQ